jgi:hypothetical protein
MPFANIDCIGWYTPRPFLYWGHPPWYFGIRIPGDGWHA